MNKKTNWFGVVIGTIIGMGGMAFIPTSNQNHQALAFFVLMIGSYIIGESHDMIGEKKQK